MFPLLYSQHSSVSICLFNCDEIVRNSLPYKRIYITIPNSFRCFLQNFRSFNNDKIRVQKTKVWIPMSHQLLRTKCPPSFNQYFPDISISAAFTFLNFKFVDCLSFPSRVQHLYIVMSLYFFPHVHILSATESGAFFNVSSSHRKVRLCLWWLRRHIPGQNLHAPVSSVSLFFPLICKSKSVFLSVSPLYLVTSNQTLI